MYCDLLLSYALPGDGFRYYSHVTLKWDYKITFYAISTVVYIVLNITKKHGSFLLILNPTGLDTTV